MPTDSTDARKINREEKAGGCPITRSADGEWLVRDYDAARALRSLDTVQAGREWRRSTICQLVSVARCCTGTARTIASTRATAPVLAFGDGAHKCPGATIAMVETDIFLGKLLALPGVRMHSPPRVGSNDAIGGYTLRDMIVEVDIH